MVMPTLQELRDAAADDCASLTPLLCAAGAYAQAKNLPILRTWLDHELNGYRETTNVPLYRRLKSTPIAFTDNNSWHSFPDVEIGLGSSVTTMDCRLSVVELTTMHECSLPLRSKFADSESEFLSQLLGIEGEYSLFVSADRLEHILYDVRKSLWTCLSQLEGELYSL
ncbi:hypothetical protein [Salinivibrio sp. VYel1]|uniref:AbiTii domain-containing protein n=1 Tax=Salinivibrio sp. VYel1 TaxID=2490490 RepID=UPI00128C56C2|nr:hypothetical protein [Salinivibrio sp. VYel1]MPX91449.1 hypothetical protein [Salinivibrio sp. VYel1]